MKTLGKEELEALSKLFEKGKLFRYQGEGVKGECDLFEEDFSKAFHCKNTLLLSSGTNSLYLALACSGIGPGDEVVIPAYTFVATAQAVIMCGAIPVIANIDENLGLDSFDLKNKISDKTRAVVVVHMDGLSADMDSIKKICDEKGLKLIEDVAQAMGGTYKGEKLGTIGDFGCFSLNESKILNCGEGGILITNDDESFKKAKLLHDGPSLFGETNKATFSEIEPFIGKSMRVSEISGAIMRVQLTKLEVILEELQKRKDSLKKGLGEVKRGMLILGNDSKGDCSSSLHLKFESPELLRKVMEKIKDIDRSFYPIMARPAHFCWQWMGLFGEKSSIDPRQNPFSSIEKKYNYKKPMFLESIDISTCVLKCDINLERSIDDYYEVGLKIKNEILDHL
jgi:dTDP-4-amino-4,6-dideoxygalactose transaminase